MITNKTPKIGYALGGGSARGLAHIGILKVLEEEHIYPEIITGTSIGALIGALYASKLSASEIEHLVINIDWKRMALFSDFTLPRSGLIQGKRVISLLGSILKERDFADLKIKFACVATDIGTGQQVVMDNGPLLTALRATMSLPGIFTPVKRDGVYLVDGGVVNKVPVATCRKLGADFVIAVNVIPDPALSFTAKSEPDSQEIVENNKESETDCSNFNEEQTGSLRARALRIECAIRNFLDQFQQKRGRSSKFTEDHPFKHITRAPNIFDVLVKSLDILEYRVSLENIRNADIAINPEVVGISSFQFDKAKTLIQEGEIAARAAIAENRDKLKAIGIGVT